MSPKYFLEQYRLKNAVCLWKSLHGKTEMYLRDLKWIKIVENLPWFQSECKTVSYSMNIFWLMQRPNPVFDVTDDAIACFQHHVTCGGKHLEWQSLSHKNWWWLGLNAVKIFSYDSKVKLKVTRFEKIPICLSEKAWVYANLSDLWTIQYGHFVSKRFS